jgi:magnesium transporter
VLSGDDPPVSQAGVHAKVRTADAPLEGLRSLQLPRRARRRKPPRGSVPGTMAPLAGPDPVIRLTTYTPEGCEERTLGDVEEIASLVGDRSRVVWIDVESFGDGRLIARIGEMLEIHALAMADVVNVPQRPKAEVYGDRLLLITQMARLEKSAIDLEQVSIVLGPGWVVTFQEHPGDVFEPVRERIRQGARVRRMGPDYLAYALLDAVIDGYFPVVEAIASTVDELEEVVISKPNHVSLARIHAMRRRVLNLHRVQWRQRDAIHSLLRDESMPFSDSVKPYLRDTHDHAFQTLDAIESFREMLVGLIELQLSSASHRLNEVMKTLTIVATIFIPLTFVAGVYGMNFDYMPELRWRWGYAAVWLSFVVTAVAFLLWFRRRGWIGNRDDAR